MNVSISEKEREGTQVRFQNNNPEKDTVLTLTDIPLNTPVEVFLFTTSIRLQLYYSSLFDPLQYGIGLLFPSMNNVKF